MGGKTSGGFKVSEELKPCPFCGGEAELDTLSQYTNVFTGAKETGIAIYCRDCVAEIMICRGDVPDVTPEMVEEMWNRRATPPGLSPAQL